MRLCLNWHNAHARFHFVFVPTDPFSQTEIFEPIVVIEQRAEIIAFDVAFFVEQQRFMDVVNAQIFHPVLDQFSGGKVNCGVQFKRPFSANSKRPA